jgi:hypothetical protein
MDEARVGTLDLFASLSKRERREVARHADEGGHAGGQPRKALA